jgi:hypothetical protein
MSGNEIDPSNPIVRRCAGGIQAEMAGRPEEARDAYRTAWDEASDAYERAIAAHYVARLVATETERRDWNAVALEEALRVRDAWRIATFLPSLHLNLGHSMEVLGELDAAREHYRLGRQSLATLGADPYAAVVRGGLEAAERRIG